jgi:hypothetical protein
MKSIKQQYIDLREGRMSQANFMRNLRMTMPQYITNVTSFNDSIRILKNKGILNEILDPTAAEEIAKTAGSYEAAVDKLMDMGLNSREANNIATDIYGMDEILDPTAAEEIAKTAGNYEAAVDKLTDMGLTPQEANNVATDIYGMDEVESLNEAKDEKTKWTNTSGKSMYDQFSEINNLNGQEVLIGIDYEIEKNHELTKAAATKIVIKNLKKNPIYYTSALMAGKEGYEAEYIGGKSANAEARQMQYLDKNMGNVVDKKMGMQPVKDVEKFKKDSDTATAQKYKTSGISLMSLVAKSTRGVKKMDATGEKMKKVTMNEGQYDFIGRFRSGEEKVLRDTISDAKIEVEEEDQKVTTYVTSEKHSDEEVKKAVKSIISKVNEVRFNDFGDPNEVTSAAMQFIDSNPTLKSISDKLTIQNSYDDAILRYDYWEVLPNTALAKLEMQFNVERMNDFDEDTGTIVAYRLTPKRPTGSIFDRNAGITAGLNDINENELIERVHKKLKEMFDGMEPMSRKGLDNI